MSPIIAERSYMVIYISPKNPPFSSLPPRWRDRKENPPARRKVTIGRSVVHVYT